MLIFGGINLRLFDFGEEKVEHIAVIEEGEGYKIYKNSDGSNTLELTMESPVNEGMIAVQNDVYDYKSLDANADIYFNPDFKAGEPSIMIDRAGMKIELAPMVQTTASVSRTDGYDKENGTYEKVYSIDAFGEGIDLEYTPITGGVKENIILNAPTDINEFSYILNIENLTAELVSNNIILKNSDGEEKYILSAPIMTDAKDAESDDIQITLEEITHTEYKVTLIPDQEWIEDVERSYPIVIDPKITSSTTSLVRDSYVSSEAGETARNYGTSDRLYVGVDNSLDKYRAYIDFNMPASLPSQIIVTNAVVKISRTNTQIADCFAALYEPNSTWSESAITWNNQPGTGGKYSNYNTRIKGADTYTFDATAYAMDIFPDGEYVGNAANKGVVLRALREDIRSGYIQKNMHSSEKAGGTLKLEITYNVPISIPAPTATPNGNEANSKDGYVDLSWDAVAGASWYYVGIFNGDEYQVVRVGNVTSWSTKDKKVWPTTTQTDAGQYKLRADASGNLTNDGDELNIFPNMAYQNAPDGTVDYDNDTNYYFIILPHNSSGYMTYPAYCDKATIKLPDVIEPSTPSTLTINPSTWSNLNSHTLTWIGVIDYNGTNFVTTGIGSVEYAIESGALTAPSAGATWNSTGQADGDASYAIDTSALADNTYTIFQRTVDTAGNTSDNAYVNIYIDRTIPTIGAGSFVSDAINWTNTNSVTFTYDTISDALSGVNTSQLYQGLSYIGDVDTGLTEYDLDTTAVTYDESIYTLHVIDNAGNELTQDAYVRIDKQAPQVSITSPADAGSVNNIVEIWGTLTDGAYASMDSYVVEVLRYDSTGTYIKTITLESGANAYYSNELINILDTSSFNDGDILKIHLTATDKVGYTSEDTVTVTVDKAVVTLAETLTISAPVNGGIADDEFEQIVYTRDGAAVGTLDEISLFVDGSLFTTIPTGDVFFKTLRYLENTQHSIALVGENSNGDFEFSQEIAQRTALSSTMDVADVQTSDNITFLPNGIELTNQTLSGNVIFNPITLNSTDLTYLVNASISPTGAPVTIDVSFDDGTTWTTITNNEEYLLDNDSTEMLVRLTIDAGATKVLGAQVKCANIQNPYNITVQTVKPVEGLRNTANTLGRITIGWNGSFDTDIRYDVYRGTTSGFAPSVANRVVTQSDHIIYADTNVSAGTTYYYKVVATKTYPVATPYYPFRESDARTISITAYKRPVYTNITPPDEPPIWEDLKEVKDANNADELYNGNWTVNNKLPPPDGASEMNQSMLGARTFCAAGFEPINFVNGNFFMKQLDDTYATMPDVNSSILRTYNTQSLEKDGPFGSGWAWYYSMHLKLYSTGDIGMIQTDGHLAMFRIQQDGTYINDVDERMEFSKGADEYIITQQDMEQVVFDSGGQLKRIVSENGNTTEVKYDDRGIIDKIVFSTGKVLDMTTDKNGHITLITMPDGEKIYYNYDGNNLVKYYDTAGDATRYIYDEQGRMIEWYDKENNRQVHNVYDDENRVTEQWDANDFYYKLEYRQNSVVTTDGEGDSKEYYFDEMGRTTKTVDSSGFSQEYKYNASSLVVEYTDKLGMVTKYGYDANDNLIKETTNDNRVRHYTYDGDNNLTGETDYMGNWTVYEYDAKSNLTKRTYPDGSAYLYEYNEDNQLVKLTDFAGNSEQYKYDGENMISHTDADGNVTKYEYNDKDELVKITDAKGNKTKMEYNASGNITKTILPDKTSMSYEYDAMDNMVAFADAKGQETRFEYDGLGHMLKTINPDGTEIGYEYDGNGNLARTVYADGTYVTNTYDSNKNLISTADQDGRTYQMAYNPVGDIVKIIEPNSTASRLNYDAKSGWLNKTTDGNNAETKFEYDANGSVTRMTYTDGTATKYTYDNMGRIKTQTLNSGAVTTYNYNVLGQLESIVDPMGNATWYIYDKLGQMMEVVDSLGNRTSFNYDEIGNMTSMTDANGESITYSYDAASQLEKIIAPLGGTLNYEYDPNGQLQKVIDPIGASANNIYDEMGRVVQSMDALGAETIYEYDIIGNMVKETNALGNAFSYEYDANGNIIKITDALGNEAEFQYDVMSNVTKIEGQEGFEEAYEYDNLSCVVKTADSEGYEKYFEYDEMGRLEKESDNTDKSISYTYTSIGQVKKMTNAKGETTELFYDLNGNTTKVLFADGTTETYHYNELSQLMRQYDRVGLETTYKYDAVGNVVEVKQPSNKVYTYEYDGNYNLIKEINPLGGETVYTFDDAGNVLSVTDPMGNTTQIEYNDASMIERVVDAKGATSLTVDYSILGEVLNETDAVGNITQYSYDAVSRLTQVADPLGRITKYIYDGADNIMSVIDANSNVVNYEYNTKGMLTKEIDPLGNVEQYEYYVDGMLKQITKADSTTSDYSYDLAGRMTDVVYSDGTTIGYGYNEVGSTTTMVDKTGTTTYQYDDMQRLVSTTDSNDKTVGYTYDILGRKTSITLPDEQITQYEFDVLDRLTKVFDSSETIAEYEYDANNQLISNVRNDITTIYKYNDLGQIETLTTTKLQENIMQFEYEYDKIGNIVGEVRTEEGNTSNRAYSYDSANQLTEFNDNDYAETYTYDNVGNMLTKDINGILTSYDYNAGNQLTEEVADGQTIGYKYNANGDLTEKTTGEKYGYDIQGNLISIVGNGSDKQYEYNGNGNRLSKTVAGETTYYVNDLNQRYEQVLQTYDDKGIIDTYTYGVQRIQSNSETHLYDGRGSVVGDIDADNLFASYSYTAYGDLMPSSPKPKVFGYNAEATDFETGIQYLRARYYDTTISRFFQEDDYRGEYSTPKTMNRYMYVAGNPVTYSDPSGYYLVSDFYQKTKPIPPKHNQRYYDKMKQIEALTDTGTGNNFRYSGLGNGNNPSDRVPNPSTGDNTDIGECIVVSGGHWEGERRYNYIFIEPALKQISDLDYDGVKNITWIIDGSDYSERDIANFEKDGYANGADKVVITDAEAEFKNYIETRSADRSGQRDIPITQFYLYSHGMPGEIVLEKNKEGESDIIKVKELANYDDSAFLNTTSKFYSCRTANENDDGKSFAAEWSDMTNGETTAMEGRVYYAYTTHSEGQDTGRIEKETIRFLRNWDIVGINYITIRPGFSAFEYQIPLIKSEYHGRGYLHNGSYNYPIPLEREDADWKTYVDGVEKTN